MNMEVRILPIVARELEKEPPSLKESVYSVLDRLDCGETIPMPLCRPLFSIARGLYELRFSSRAGEHRVFYYIKVGEAIYVIHAMKKKSQKMERRTIDLLKMRIKSLL